MPEQTVQQMLDAMDDSVAYINAASELPVLTNDDWWADYTIDGVRRNRDHLIYSLGLDAIINSGADLTPYADAITLANNLLGE